MIDDLKGLIAIPSVVNYDEGGFPMGMNCKKALDYMQSLFERYGFACQNGSDFYLSSLHCGKNGKHELGMLGHVDVVPARSGWTADPFTPIEKNGYLIGRGALDNKGPIVMALYVMRALRDLDIPLSGNLRFIIGCDEEKEMRDVRRFLSEHKPPAFTLNCDGKWPVCIGEKGILNADLMLPWQSDTLLSLGGGDAPNMVPDSAWARIRISSHDNSTIGGQINPYSSVSEQGDCLLLRVSGKAAHVSAPYCGDNAVRRLFQILCEGEWLNNDEKRQLKQLLLALRDDEGTGLQISHADRQSGSSVCVPTQLKKQDDCICVHLNIRYAVTQSGDLLLRKLKSRCEHLGLQVTNVSDSPPRFDSVQRPEIKLLMENCREFVSKRCQPYVSSGGTHSRVFPSSIPFGPLMPEWIRRSRFGGPHAADEAVFIDDLFLGIKVYTAALIRLDRYYSTFPPSTQS